MGVAITVVGVPVPVYGTAVATGRALGATATVIVD